MAGAGLNVGRQLAHSARLPPQHVRSREPDQPHAGRRDHAGAQRAVSRASGLDRIVGVMSATGSYDTLPSHRCRGATVGPPACSAQSSSVVFRARCRICLQGLSSSWDDWRRHAASLIRKRSQVRVLDRPSAGIQEFAAFAQCSGFGTAGRSGDLGRSWGHMGPPAITGGRESAPGFAPPARRRRTPRTPSGAC
jgi:hypothetical protein